MMSLLCYGYKLQMFENEEGSFYISQPTDLLQKCSVVLCLHCSKLIMLSVMTASHHNSHLIVRVNAGSAVLSLAQLNKQGTQFHAGAASSHTRAAIIMACSTANWKH